MASEQNIIAFEQPLADEWAVDRRDIGTDGLFYPSMLGDRAVRPSKVLEHLGIDQSELIALLIAGILPRPGKLGHGRVAWRLDEIAKVRAQIEEARADIDDDEEI